MSTNPTVTVLLTLDSNAIALLRSIDKRLKNMEERQALMATDLDVILSDVQDETTVEKSVLVLLQSFSDQLKAAGTDPVKLAAIRKQIADNKTAMVAAIVANTPVVASTGPTAIPASISISVGASLQLAVDDAKGVDITASATYKSSDPSVASVDTAGNVTGVSAGTTAITVTDTAGNSTTVPVTVS